MGQTLSSIGDGVYVIAFIWLSLKLSDGRGLIMGGIFSIYTLGELIFGFISGPVVDRFNKQKILIFMDLTRGSLLCILYVTIRLGTATVTLLYVCTFLFATFSAFFHRAEFAILPEITHKSRLLKANGLLTGLKRLMRVLAPAVGGVIIQSFGTEACFLFDGLSFFSSMLCIALVRVTVGKSGKQPKTFRYMMSDIKKGCLIVVQSSLFLTLSIYAACINFVGAPVFPLLPILSENVSTGASGYGAMMSALSAGLIAASFLIFYVDRFLSRIRIMLMGICFSALGILVISLSQDIITIAPACFMIGVGLSLANIPIQTIFQEKIPSENIGVVSGFVFTAAQVAMPISMVLSGVIIHFLSVSAVFKMISTLMFIGAIIGFFLPQFK